MQGGRVFVWNRSPVVSTRRFFFVLPRCFVFSSRELCWGGHSSCPAPRTSIRPRSGPKFGPDVPVCGLKERRRPGFQSAGTTWSEKNGKNDKKLLTRCRYEQLQERAFHLRDLRSGRGRRRLRAESYCKYRGLPWHTNTPFRELRSTLVLQHPMYSLVQGQRWCGRSAIPVAEDCGLAAPTRRLRSIAVQIGGGNCSFGQNSGRFRTPSWFSNNVSPKTDA